MLGGEPFGQFFGVCFARRVAGVVVAIAAAVVVVGNVFTFFGSDWRNKSLLGIVVFVVAAGIGGSGGDFDPFGARREKPF